MSWISKSGLSDSKVHALSSRGDSPKGVANCKLGICSPIVPETVLFEDDHSVFCWLLRKMGTTMKMVFLLEPSLCHCAVLIALYTLCHCILTLVTLPWKIRIVILILRLWKGSLEQLRNLFKVKWFVSGKPWPKSRPFDSSDSEPCMNSLQIKIWPWGF